jgi:hypothetical protein
MGRYGVCCIFHLAELISIGSLIDTYQFAPSETIMFTILNRYNRFLRTLAFGIYVCLIPSAAFSQSANIESIPTGWRLENYPGNTGANGVTLWFTGSPCVNGQLQLPANASSDDANRLWSTIISAKMANRAVGINYSKSGNSCTITSFYMT